MRVYDCDDDGQFTALSRRVEADDLVGRALMASFSPDTLAEARNRGSALADPPAGARSGEPHHRPGVCRPAMAMMPA